MGVGAEKPKNMGFGCAGSMAAAGLDIDSGLGWGVRGSRRRCSSARLGAVRCGERSAEARCVDKTVGSNGDGLTPVVLPIAWAAVARPMTSHATEAETAQNSSNRQDSGVLISASGRATVSCVLILVLVLGPGPLALLMRNARFSSIESDQMHPRSRDDESRRLGTTAVEQLNGAVGRKESVEMVVEEKGDFRARWDFSFPDTQ